MSIINCENRMFSAVQPSGMPTLGNYLGAIRNWVKSQEKFNCIFMLADLHTITVRQNPEEFRKNIIEAYALFLACGINTSKTPFFIQSHVSAHSELAWILDCYTQFGELSRMTQFKDKSKKYANDVNAGLFCYPVLMAGDILLYKSKYVPVGADQKQHVELTRDVAQRFNNIYGDTFILPEPFIPEVGARVMSLQEPTKKMSKSDANANGYIAILDSPDIIMKKFKRAVTDSEAKVEYKEGKDGVNNLMGIYSAITGKSLEEIESEFDGKGYGVFKTKVAEVVIEELRPIQEKFKDYINNIDYIKECYKKSDDIAREIADETVKEVKQKVGFVL